jgi:DNA (cytosine-5)-methyltransferase 1
MSKLRVLDLFSGIGGFSLGLERTGGFETVAFCEIEPFPQKVLRKHWPDVPIYDDVRTVTAARLAADGIAWSLADARDDRRMESDFGAMVGIQGQACEERHKETDGLRYCGVDVICGGFPCQDISFAGKGAGIEGERSGLWSEYARLIGELQPQFVIVENVAALLGRGLDRVLGDLAKIGFDAEWHCIPASAIGAPHRRDRLWLVAYPAQFPESALANAIRLRKLQSEGREQDEWGWTGDSSPDVAHAGFEDVEGQRLTIRISQERDSFSGSSWWATEPDVGRVAHGVPSRVDRLKGLGNAVVPQIPELIGRAILQSMEAA